jgi:hypothetical protein
MSLYGEIYHSRPVGSTSHNGRGDLRLTIYSANHANKSQTADGEEEKKIRIVIY